METTAIGAARGSRHQETPEVAAVGRRLLSDLGAFGSALRRQMSEALRSNKLTPLMLNYGEHVLRFPTQHEFDFALSTRTEPPPQRIAELEQLTLFELRRMATDIRKLENRFSDILAAALERGRSLRRLMAQLDLKSFSNDHDWRSIFGALADSDDDGHDPFRQVALAKYTQYLRNRQAIIQHIYAARGNEQDRDEAQSASDGSGKTALHETAIFDFTQIELGADPAQDMWLLPRGESIGITLTGVEHVDVMFAMYGFRIERNGDSLFLVDSENGTEYRLRRGRNAIGRGQGCDILVESTYREISRKHAVIDCLDEFTVVLTDLSSHGTRVPASRVIGARPTEPEFSEMTMVGVGPGSSH